VEAEAAVKAERDAELRAVEAERVAVAEVKRVVEGEAAEREEAKRSTHWTDEMDKAFAYQRDVDRRDVHRREAAALLLPGCRPWLPWNVLGCRPCSHDFPCRYGGADAGNWPLACRIGLLLVLWALFVMGISFCNELLLI
jgi:hypothetical protein